MHQRSIEIQSQRVFDLRGCPCKSCMFLLLSFPIPSAFLLVLLQNCTFSGTGRHNTGCFRVLLACLCCLFCVLCVGVLDTPSRVILVLLGLQFVRFSEIKFDNSFDFILSSFGFRRLSIEENRSPILKGDFFG